MKRKQDRTRASHKDLITIAKYVLIALMVIFVFIMFRIHRVPTKDFSAVAPALEEQLELSAMQRTDDQKLKETFGLNAADYAGVLHYEGTGNISVEQILLIEVKDEAQKADVRQALNSWLSHEKELFKAYAPEQMKRLEDAQILEKGKFLFFAVSDHSVQDVRTFRECIKGK